MEHEDDGDSNLIGALGTIPKGLVRILKDLEIGVHPNNSIIKIG